MGLKTSEFQLLNVRFYLIEVGYVRVMAVAAVCCWWCLVLLRVVVRGNANLLTPTTAVFGHFFFMVIAHTQQ